MSNLFLEQNCTFFGQDFCPSDRQKTFPKHVEFYSKNKFEKLVHLVGFIIRMYHDARSSECQIMLFRICVLQLRHNCKIKEAIQIINEYTIILLDVNIKLKQILLHNADDPPFNPLTGI